MIILVNTWVDFEYWATTPEGLQFWRLKVTKRQIDFDVGQALTVKKSKKLF